MANLFAADLVVCRLHWQSQGRRFDDLTDFCFSGQVDDIFGDEIESADAEDAEERYQQLYETERRKSGSVS